MYNVITKDLDVYREGLKSKPTLHKTFYEKLEDFTHRVLVTESWFKLYRARCRVSKGLVELKVYGRELLDSVTKARILHEYNVCSNLSNGCPHIRRAFAAFEDQGSWILVTEHCAGGDLYSVSCRTAALVQITEGWLSSVVIAPLLSTLVYLHANGITHRDVKPENIYFTSSGVCKLAGFFLAVHKSEESVLDNVCGTLDYIAPETLLNLKGSKDGKDKCSPAVDIWALGITVYDMLAGSPPFADEDPDVTVEKITTSSMRDLELPDHMSMEAIDFVQQALVKEPQHRPPASVLLRHPWIAKHASWQPPDGWRSPLQLDVPKDDVEPPPRKMGIRMVLSSMLNLGSPLTRQVASIFKALRRDPRPNRTSLNEEIRVGDKVIKVNGQSGLARRESTQNEHRRASVELARPKALGIVPSINLGRLSISSPTTPQEVPRSRSPSGAQDTIIAIHPVPAAGVVKEMAQTWQLKAQARGSPSNHMAHPATGARQPMDWVASSESQTLSVDKALLASLL